MGARCSLAGEEKVIIAGGPESMTRAPLVVKKSETVFPRGNMEMVDTTIGWRFVNPGLHDKYGTDAMPKTAENVANKYQISRAAQDELALKRQQKTSIAVENNYCADEIIPFTSHHPTGNKSTVTI